jgi:hypothetical protein
VTDFLKQNRTIASRRTFKFSLHNAILIVAFLLGMVCFVFLSRFVYKEFIAFGKIPAKEGIKKELLLPAKQKSPAKKVKVAFS